MRTLSLLQRLTLVFALLIFSCSALTIWIQTENRTRYGDAMIQNLSRNLAASIAGSSALMNNQGIDTQALKGLFTQMMAYNPSVEVYLLDRQGHILADAAPEGHLKRRQVALAPLHQLLAGRPLPLYGDDPRSNMRKKVFSAAPITVAGSPAGYLYVILQGEDYNQLNSNALSSSLRRSMLTSFAIIALCGLIAGGIIWLRVTRPISRLTRNVNDPDSHSPQLIAALAAMPLPAADQRDEVAILERAFIALAQRISAQWECLAQQDHQRREFIATISHDLRTPLMSIQGYLETLSVKASSLSDEERSRYLQIALTQSEKVGMLAQQLFELARLEHGAVTPQRERFSLCDLVQDVVQKFELPMHERQQTLQVAIPATLPLVDADMSMVERVLTNLLDNAVRHTPPQGQITLRLWQETALVQVEISDSGPGVAAALKETLFERPAITSASRRENGGLGLMIVRRLLQLHQADIQLIDTPVGACFRFYLPQ